MGQWNFWVLMIIATFLRKPVRALSRSALRQRVTTAASASSSSDGDSYLSIHVKGSLVEGAEKQQAFYVNSLANARASVLEQGVARFDVLRRIDGTSPEGAGEFLLMEVYRSKDGPDAHKATAHYAAWRDGVSAMMSAPRTAVRYRTLFPPASQWSTCKSASKITPSIYASMLPWSNAPCAESTVQPVAPAASESSASYTKRSLLAVVVHINVLPDFVDDFIASTVSNCRASVREGGVSRFDFLQDSSDPHHFILVEVYNSAEAPAAHKQTAHYASWASRVAPMMAKPRSAERYSTVYPAPIFWHQTSAVTHPGEGSVGDGGLSQGLKGLGAVAGGSFGFLSPKILMGRGIAAAALKQSLAELGAKRPLVVTGKTGFDRYKTSLLEPALGNAEHYSARYAVVGEPTVEDVKIATKLAIEHECDSVVAIGGGSAIDLGKAVSALATNRDDIFEYLEVIGKGRAINNLPLPCIAIPTTAGTGSEATKNAVIKCTILGRKASIRHDSMLPKVAIVDPVLTTSCPPDVTAHVGLDTLCQVIEPYCSNAANPFTDALTKEAILRASRSLRTVVSDGGDIEAREDLTVASVMGGLALANAKLGAVHGYAAVLGGMFEVAPHGAICATLLPHVFRKNAEKLAEGAATGDSASRVRLQRVVDVARIVTGNPQANWTDGVAWLDALVKDCRVPCLSDLCGLTSHQISEVAQATAEASSTKGNPVKLSVEDLEDILRKAL